MSIILGINCLHSDSSACIIKDGVLEFAIEEERINREKHTSDLPIKAINECLIHTNTKENEITHIAFNTKPNSNFFQKLKFLIKNLNFKNNFVKRYKNKSLLNKIFKEKFNFNKNVKFFFIEHHLAHIASSFYASNFDKAIGLSIDGSGDFVSMMIAECEKSKIMFKKKLYFPNSLGIFYQAMTQFIGFKNFGDEYKMMGLASYGKPIYFEKLKKNLFLDKDEFFTLNPFYFNHYKTNFNYSHIFSNNQLPIYNEKLKDLFKEESSKNKADSFKKDFAASVQKIYEHFFIKIINYIEKSNFSNNLVFAGGCALNSTANNLIINNKTFQNVFIPVAPGDNGGCLGAAFYVSRENLKKNNNFNNPFVGNKYSDEEIKKLIEKKYLNAINYEKFKTETDKYDTATDIIINKGVVGWFQDKMEFGPRALGNRSILADPRNPNVKDLINIKIKRREKFRPFAPSILADHQKNWYNEKFDGKYMSAVMKVREEKKKFIPGVVHIDDTSRVQTVTKNSNMNFYNLINNFYKKTQIPLILNTSFNENEPIVRTPDEAIDCLLRTNMDALFIGSFIITKK